MNARLEIRRRRRVAASIGFAALTMISATACIFETSNYKGGGRADQGGQVQTPDPTTSATPAPAPQPTVAPVNDSGQPDVFVEAGDDG
jgi:hypothetical protein